VVVSVCFLAAGADRLIEPEVLSKAPARYLDARQRDPATAERIVEKPSGEAKSVGMRAPCALTDAMSTARVEMAANPRACYERPHVTFFRCDIWAA
jgi:hypothetical protein